MATVHRAWDRLLRAPRAVKILKPSARRNSRYRARFAAEARAMAALEHPHILRVYDYGDGEDATFIVTAFAEGGTLSTRLDRGGPLAVSEATRVLVAVLEALDAAHRAGIVHRDVKPMNILLDGDDKPLVADFGIALDARAESRRTRAGVSLGTFAYMAPEQRMDASRVTAAADQYATAAMFFELITGESPIDLFAVREDSPRWWRVPAPLRPVLQRALAYRPEDRFEDALALRDALLSALPGCAEVAALPPASEGRDLAPTHTQGAGPDTSDLSDEGESLHDEDTEATDRLQDLGRWYRRSLAEKAEQLRSLLLAAKQGESGTHELLRRLAHTLRGSGATFGYPTVTDAAALTEDASEEALVPRATELLYVLRHLSEARPSTAKEGVLIALGDPEEREHVGMSLRRAHPDLRLVGALGAARNELSQGGVGVLVLDVELVGSETPGLAGGLVAGQVMDPIPVVAVGPDDADLRATTLAAGAVSYHARPLDLVSLAVAVESALRHDRDVSTMDPVTQLPDRAAFRLSVLRLQQTVHTSQDWTLAAVAWPGWGDPDEVAPALADGAIRQVAIALRRALPPSLTLARWDAGLLMVLAPEAGVDEVAGRLTDALARVGDQVTVGDDVVPVHLGAAAVAGCPTDLGQLLVLAQRAAHSAALQSSGAVRVVDSGIVAVSGRVLVVDDDPSIVRLVSRIASSAGLAVTSVASGEQAVPAALAIRPDVIVLDVELPGIDGFEVLRALRAEPALADVHVLMLTSMDREPHVVLGLELGADDYVAKPFDPTVLQARIRRLVRRSRR